MHMLGSPICDLEEHSSAAFMRGWGPQSPKPLSVPACGYGRKYTSFWPNAVPADALGTHVDPLLFITMVQRWLRVPIYDSEFHCTYCDDMVDRFGDHCLTCSVGGDRAKRHNLLRNEVYYFCNSSGLNPELERQGLLPPRPLTGATQENEASRDIGGGRRPAYVHLGAYFITSY